MPSGDPTGPEPGEFECDDRRAAGLYRAAFGNTPIGIGLGQLDGTFLDVNPTYCAQLGYSREEMLGMKVADLSYPEDWEVQRLRFEELASGRADEFTMIKRNRHKLGHLVWFEVNVRVVRFAGKPSFLVGAARTVDEGGELRELRRERDAFFELSPDVLGILERRDGRAWFRRVNPALCKLLGYSAAELCARPTIEFVHPDDRERTLLYGCMSGRATPGSFFENRYVAKSGESRWISWTSCTTHETTYCIGRDVTMDKARVASESERQARLHAAGKLSALGLMAANISHEIKNPLAIVYGNACRLQALLVDRVDHSARRMADEIAEMSRRIVKIVDGLRGFTREASRDPFETVELRRLLEETLAFCRSGFTADRVLLETDVPSREVSIFGQPVQIQQVVLNLLSNAFQAALATKEDQPRVGLRVEGGEDFVEISICDNGPGIDPTIRNYLFEPFFTTKKAGTGTGLGLSIAKSIVEAHHGQLYLCEECRVTTFKVILPTRDLG